MHKRLLFLLLVLFLLNVNTKPAYASIGLIARGTAKILSAVVQLPLSVLQGSTSSFPLGIAAGAIGGTLRTVAGTIAGTFDVARGAAPYAKYAIFAL